MATPRLTVLGVGPGGPELPTLKGARVPSEADVTLYDVLPGRAAPHEPNNIRND